MALICVNNAGPCSGCGMCLDTVRCSICGFPLHGNYYCTGGIQICGACAKGIIGDFTISKFANEHTKREHEKNFCISRHCQGCGVYCALMQNYSCTRVGVYRKKETIRH